MVTDQEILRQRRWAFKLARRFHARYADAEDMQQEALLGLCIAGARFDPSKSVFMTYATHWIRCCCRKTVLHNTRLGPFGSPRMHRMLFYRGRRTQTPEALWGLLQTVAGHNPVRPEEVSLARAWLTQAETRLDALPENSSKPNSRANNLEDRRLLQALERAPDAKALWKALEAFRSRLTPKWRDVLERRILYPDPEATLHQIGQSWGISRERVRQIESRLLQSLRDRLKKFEHAFE